MSRHLTASTCGQGLDLRTRDTGSGSVGIERNAWSFRRSTPVSATKVGHVVVMILPVCVLVFCHGWQKYSGKVLQLDMTGDGIAQWSHRRAEGKQRLQQSNLASATRYCARAKGSTLSYQSHDVATPSEPCFLSKILAVAHFGLRLR